MSRTFRDCNYFIIYIKLKKMKTHSLEQNSSSIISRGKKVFFLIVFLAIAFLQKSFAQDNNIPQSQLLHSYYDIKNALVAGNAGAASSNAADFIKALNSMDDKMAVKTHAKLF